MGAEGELFLDDCQCENVRLCDLLSKLDCVQYQVGHKPPGTSSFYRRVRVCDIWMWMG